MTERAAKSVTRLGWSEWWRALDFDEKATVVLIVGTLALFAVCIVLAVVWWIA